MESYFEMTSLSNCFNIVFSSQAEITQPVFTYSKLTIETLEHGVKYVQS